MRRPVRTRLPTIAAPAVVAVVIAALAIAPSAAAQIQPKSYPSVRTSDPVNVDIMTGLPFWSIEDVRIGDQSFGLEHSFHSYEASFSILQDSFNGGRIYTDGEGQCRVQWLGTPVLMMYRQMGECFYLSNGVYTSNEGKGGHLENDGTGNLIYTIRDGTRVYASYSYNYAQFQALITRVERPDGLVTTIHYSAGGTRGFSRISGVSNNAGFRLQYSYESNDPESSTWWAISGITAYNAAYVACEPSVECVIPGDWPRSQVIQTRGQAYSTRFITAGGEQWVFSGNDDPFPNYKRFTSVQLPTNSVPSISYQYCPHGPGCTIGTYAYPGPYTFTIQQFTLSATMDGATWSYGMQTPGGNLVIRNSTSPTGQTIEAIQREEGYMQSFRIPGTRFDYNGGFEDHITTVTRGQGDSLGYAYDSRGNITGTSHTPAAGFGGPVLSDSATYPATCANRITCNRPQSVTDANGNTTVYEYDPVHGGVVKSTGPRVNGIDRETRYVYVQRYASYLSATGAVIQDSNPIWLLSEERSCRTGAALGSGCVIAGDEVVTRYEYGPTTGVNNLLLRGVVQDATGLSLRTCYGYDRYGNRISETTPNANLASCP